MLFRSHRLLRKPEVAAEIAERKQKTAEKLQISREDALAHAWNVVMADARELIEFVVGCCRHCHGTDFGFQWRDREEFELAIEAATREHDKQVKAASSKPGTVAPVLRLPNDRGGYGFDPRLGAHANCPRCLGAGEGRAVVKDTRTLSPTAAALYAGVKQTKEGLEVKMHSKLDALEKIFRHLGLYERDNDQKKPIGLSAELAAFAAQIHSNNAGRLPFAPARKA